MSEQRPNPSFDGDAAEARRPLAQRSPFEKLVGDLTSAYFRRINIQHRIVYEVFAKERTARVLPMWANYE